MSQDDLLTFTLATVGFYGVAGVTWFFASRRRLFIRVFVPAHELRSAVRGIPRDPHFCRGMRFIALLQAVAATAFGVAAAWRWFAGQ